jgi:hypothetical protein
VEDQVGALLGQRGEVVVPGAGIAVEVLAGPELGRVDEHRHHDRRRALAGGPDERAVPLVQGAHRRHQRNGAGEVGTPLPEVRDRLGDGGSRGHRDSAASAEADSRSSSGAPSCRLSRPAASARSVVLRAMAT